jgi:hypothetical protein
MAHEQDDAPEGSGFEWFNCDYDALVKQNDEDSWYRRLSAVATAVMVQWLRVKCGFTQPGGSHVLPSKSSLQLILEHIPTQPTSDGQYPPFPVADMPLDEWLAASESFPPPVTKDDMAVDYITKEPKIMMDGTNEFTQEALNQFPQPPFEPATIPLAVPNPILIKPARMYAPELTAADLAFLSGNTAMKVAIAHAYAQEELNAWPLWYDLCGRQILSWRKKIKELEESEAQLRERKKNGMKLLELLLHTKSGLEATRNRTEGPAI